MQTRPLFLAWTVPVLYPLSGEWELGNFNYEASSLTTPQHRTHCSRKDLAMFAHPCSRSSCRRRWRCRCCYCWVILGPIAWHMHTRLVGKFTCQICCAYAMECECSRRCRRRRRRRRSSHSHVHCCHCVLHAGGRCWLVGRVVCTTSWIMDTFRATLNAQQWVTLPRPNHHRRRPARAFSRRLGKLFGIVDVITPESPTLPPFGGANQSQSR